MSELHINQISLEKHLPSDASGNISERERAVALALADEVLNVALHLYAETLKNGGQVGEEFFNRMAHDKGANQIQLRILKCYSENISRINFLMMPDDVQAEILEDLLDGRLKGQDIPQEMADEVLEVLNSGAAGMDSDLEKLFNIGTSSDK